MMARDLTPDQQALQNCVVELDVLDREVGERLKPYRDETKRIPFDLSRDFIFAQESNLGQGVHGHWDMRPQQRTFVNGAEDLYLSKPHFEVTGGIDGGGSHLLNPSSLFRTPAGMMIRGHLPFDFFWNWTIASQGEKYGSPVQDLQWLSRQSLGNRSRWLPLAFRYPLRLKGGDSITWMVKPAFYTMEGIGGGQRYTYVVNMTMTGYRTGQMSESQFDPEFRPHYRKDRA